MNFLKAVGFTIFMIALGTHVNGDTGAICGMLLGLRVIFE